MSCRCRSNRRPQQQQQQQLWLLSMRQMHLWRGIKLSFTICRTCQRFLSHHGKNSSPSLSVSAFVCVCVCACVCVCVVCVVCVFLYTIRHNSEPWEEKSYLPHSLSLSRAPVSLLNPIRQGSIPCTCFRGPDFSRASFSSSSSSSSSLSPLVRKRGRRHNRKKRINAGRER